MTEGVLERHAAAEAEAEDVLTMHLAAMRVMDSTRGGGWGTFRVDGITDEQAERLPSYLAGYKGEWLESVYFDDEGNLQVGGRIGVDERHSKFSQGQVFKNPETGVIQRFFKWDRELWDPEATAAADHQALVVERKRKALKYGSRIAIGIASLTSLLGVVRVLTTTAEEGRLKRDDASQYEIKKAEQNSERAVEDLAKLTVAYMVTATGSLVVLALQDGKRLEPLEGSKA